MPRHVPPDPLGGSRAEEHPALAATVTSARSSADDGIPARGPADATRTGDPAPATRSAAGTLPEPHAASATQIHDPGRYQILGEHGRGGLGRVSRARDLDLGRDVAIKELISRSQLGEVRFLREALITARLEHPGIVPVHEAGRWPDGTPFYAMKLVAGRPLRALIAERTTVTDRIGLLHHVIAVADAIAYAHGRNIIHRDLKPSNIIVGEFGETVVIDWGLAKDLSTAPDAVTSGDSFRTSRGDDLTEAGSVLGTPAYMSPEQERGEHVDQRADVFAIGAMLWELCALQKVPPTEPRERSRLLRRAGIDRDLATIIDKALAPDPEQRYRDAGELAVDLKAFKSGARIAARSYSLLAMLGHWTRRHRALAGSVVAAVALAVAGSAFYLRSVTIERDRAEASSNRLTLEQAELLMRKDPTAASDLLHSYTGADRQRRAMLTAQATGLGVATLRARPHTQRVSFLRALADGSLVTVGKDGTVAKTSPAGATRIIGHGVTTQYAPGYDPARHLLAYVCEPTTVCLLDVERETAQPAPAGDLAAVALAFSPSGDLLAAISARGQAWVWQLSHTAAPVERYQASFDSGESISFIDETTIVAQGSNHARLIHLDGATAPTPVELATPGATDLATSADLHLLVVGTSAGALIVIDGATNQIVRQAAVCKSQVNGVAVLPRRATAAYACQDGDAGILELAAQSSPSIVAHFESSATMVRGSDDGRYLLIAGSNGRLASYDLASQTLNSYIGHVTRPSVVLPPSAAFPHIASGDTTGVLRVWSPPAEGVRVVAKTNSLMVNAILLPDHGPLIAIGGGSTIPWRAADGTTGELQDHNANNMTVAVSATRAQFVTFGGNDEVELWSFDATFSRHAVTSSHGRVAAAVLAPDSGHMVTGAVDGTVTEWQHDGASHRDLGTIHEPIYFMRAVPNTGAVVVGGVSNALWLANGTAIVQLGKAQASITTAETSRDGRWLAVGTTRGDVALYGLASRDTIALLGARSGIEHLAFSADGRELAVATDSQVRLVPTDAAAGGERRTHDIELAARHLVYSRDGEWLAATCDRGDIWFLRRRDNHWIYLSTGTAMVAYGGFSEDSQQFSAADSSGRALLIDMRATLFH